MKHLTLILLLALSSIVQCQDANIITETEFNNIKINNVKLSTIINTFGNKNAIEGLFGASIAHNLDADGNYFEYNGFEIGFSALLSVNYNEPTLGGFDIINNNFSITINGTRVTVGDNISLLGNTIKNTKSDGTLGILYMYCNGCNNFISIDYNQITNIIEKITYIEQT